MDGHKERRGEQHMEQRTTNDGLVTFYSVQDEDNYHTLQGTKEEIREKHLNASQYAPGSVCFDICFGLGYTTAAALDRGPATIYCFENDETILRKIIEIDADFASYPLIKAFINGFFDGNNVYEKDGVKLVMLFGDARERIHDVPQRAQHVWFAPFSPAKVPHLWTQEFFRDIKAKMVPSARLTTYSYARFVRENLHAAGFLVLDGPTISRRSPSTIAVVPG